MASNHERTLLPGIYPPFISSLTPAWASRVSPWRHLVPAWLWPEPKRPHSAWRPPDGKPLFSSQSQIGHLDFLWAGDQSSRKASMSNQRLKTKYAGKSMMRPLYKAVLGIQRRVNAKHHGGNASARTIARHHAVQAGYKELRPERPLVVGDWFKSIERM